MDSLVLKHLQDLYGLNPNIPHLAFQFPRLPPRLPNSMFKTPGASMREQFLQDADTINQKLQGFQGMYQQYASDLLSMNSKIIPPGHPLYTRQNSVETLQTANDKLLKENLELKKQLEKKSDSK